MGKRSAGLHKQVSEIFDGVPLPKSNGTQRPSGAPTPERPNYERPRERDKEPLETPASPKPPAPSHLTHKTPKPPQQQPKEVPPKVAPAKQPDTGATIKTAKQLPWQQTWEQITKRLFATEPGVSSTKQKTMVILVPVLFIVLIFMFTRVLSTPSHQIPTPKSSVPANAVAASDKVDWRISEPYPTNLRNPMRFGSATAQAEAGGLIVKGIVYSKDNPSAVIGSRIVYEGDEVLGVTVVKINENSVDFESNDKRWTQKVQR